MAELMSLALQQLSTINQEPSTIPRSAGSLGCGCRNRLRGRIAEGEQSAFGFLSFRCTEADQRFPQRLQAKVILAASSLDTIEECGEVNHLAARVEVVKVQNLLSRHALH